MVKKKERGERRGGREGGGGGGGQGAVFNYYNEDYKPLKYTLHLETEYKYF